MNALARNRLRFQKPVKYSQTTHKHFSTKIEDCSL